MMNKLKFIFFFLFIFIIIVSYNLFFHKSCKTPIIFKSIMNLETQQLKNCISKDHLTKNLKLLLVDYSYLFDIFRAIKRTHITPDYVLDDIPNKQDEKEKKLTNYTNIETPFIKGLIENENYNKNSIRTLPDNYQEYYTWTRSHGGNWNTKYDNESGINKNNISKLKLLWKYSSINKTDLAAGKKKWKQNIELNPIFIDGKLIFTTADGKIVAANIETGEVEWEFQSLFLPSKRGMLATYDNELDINVLYIPIGSELYKININNGEKIKEFGNNGSVKIFSLVAPIIYKKKLIVVGINRTVSIFNSNDGKLIDVIPLYDKRNFLGGIPWSGVAFDNKKGVVFISTGDPRPGLYGVKRKGKNERSSSIIAVDINKKKVLWDFQETAHGLWDYDIPSPPVLHDLKIENKVYEVVISVTKTGNTLILERNTGQPIFDITYKRAPRSKIPGEITSPFQIDLQKPEKFSKIDFSLDDINKLSKSKQLEIKKELEDAEYGWYVPPYLNRDLIILGLAGGAQWTGATIDPINQNLYIPANNFPWRARPYMISIELQTSFDKKLRDNHKFYINKCSSCHGKHRNGINKIKGAIHTKYVPALVGYYLLPDLDSKISMDNINIKHEDLKLTNKESLKIQNLFKWWDKKLEKNHEVRVYANVKAWTIFRTKDGLPASNPPWGYIAKLNLVSGKIQWKSPLGYLKINGKKKKIGTSIWGGLALNAGGILFATGTEDLLAYAIDSKTGEELWTYKMEAAGSAPPIIINYNGKQYVSFVSTGGFYYNYKEKSSSIYTFAIYND